MLFYDFTIDGRRVGYFEIEEGPGEIYMNARIFVGGSREENLFRVRHDNGRPMAVQTGASPWRDVPPGAYPTSAYPLILQAGLRRYSAFIEGSGKIEERVIHLEDGVLVEYAGARITRKFLREGDRISYICWGGTAESRLAFSREEAVRGTVFADL